MVVNPMIPTEGLFKLLTLPQYGYLVKGKTRLQVGSKFSQQDIFDEQIKFVSTTKVPDNVEFLEDSFKYNLYKYGLGNITADSYNTCLPDRDIEVPEDGIFEFSIRINKMTPPTITLIENKINVVEEKSTVLDNTVIHAELDGVSPNDLIYKLNTPLTNGYLSLRGKKTTMFTQADVNSNSIRYVATGMAPAWDTISLMVCTKTNQCVGPTVIDVEIHADFKQIGDNVIYARIDSVFTWTFQTNKPNALWSLRGGSDISPRNASTPSTGIIDWSNYAIADGAPLDDPERGLGFDKLIQYKNLHEQFYWDGGLPTGVAVSSIGYVGTQYRIPLSQAGTQPWKLPIEPGRYLFTVTAIDPVTGLSATRRYALITTQTGTNSAGLQSETQIL